MLVVDVRMEGMSGLEAFAHMRQQGVELACLVITGYATEEDSIRAIRLGVGDYLRKPFEMRELLLRLARVSAVYQRQRRRPLARAAAPAPVGLAASAPLPPGSSPGRGTGRPVSAGPATR